MNLPDIELVAARVPEAWMENKRRTGITTQKLESGEELMVPYEELSECQATRPGHGAISVGRDHCCRTLDRPLISGDQVLLARSGHANIRMGKLEMAVLEDRKGVRLASAR